MDQKDKQQQCLEMVVMGVVAQGGPGRRGDLFAYHGVDGTHCHIGFLLPDDLEAHGIDEEWDLHMLRYEAPEGAIPDGLWDLDLWFLKQLQYAHDGCHDPADPIDWNWEEYAERVHDLCRRFHLRYPGELL